MSGTVDPHDAAPRAGSQATGPALPAASSPAAPAGPSSARPRSAWPPSGAGVDAQPTLTRARVGGLARAFLRSPVEAASWRALIAILLGFGIAVFAISLLSFLFSTGGSLLIWLVGIPVVALGIEASRLVARAERWRMTFVDGRPLVAHLYRPYDGLPRSPYGRWLRAWGETQFLDVNRWRDVVYVLVLFPLAVLELVVTLLLWSAALVLIVSPAVVAMLSVSGAFERISDRLGAAAGAVVDVSGSALAASLFALLVGLLLVPVAASTGRGLMRLHRAVVAGLLCVDPTVALREDVERLRGSRSAALELEASELRRIERDLHDGAQQRLVMLSIDLGLAEDRLATDPGSARQLVADAREQARLALAELRDLVRGTAPSILLDRGLVAALGAVAGNCPVPTTVDNALREGERLPAAVERAAYFVVAESLANVAKHSGASHASVSLRMIRGEASAAAPPRVAPPTGVTAPAPGMAVAAPAAAGAAVAAPSAPGAPWAAASASGSEAPRGPWVPMWPAGPAAVAAPGTQVPTWPGGVAGSPAARSVLIVEVADDGAGGAVLAPGGGLAGLRDRVEALDGTLTLSSPPGGPTVVHVEIPIAW